MPSTIMKMTTSMRDMPRCRRLLHIASLGIDGDCPSGNVQHHALTWLTESIERERQCTYLHDYGDSGRCNENVVLTIRDLSESSPCGTAGGITQCDLSWGDLLYKHNTALRHCLAL